MGLGTWGIGVMENWSLGAGGTGTHLCRKLNRKLRREFGGWGSTKLRTKLTPKGNKRWSYSLCRKLNRKLRNLFINSHFTAF